MLQGLDDRIEEVAAAAHQDEHVAIAEPTPGAFRAGHGAACNQPLDLGLDAFRELDLGTRHRHAVEWRAPALDVRAIVGLDQWP